MEKSMTAMTSTSSATAALTAALTLLLIPTIFYATRSGRLFGYAKIAFFHSPGQIVLRTKDGKSVPFSDFCKSVTPPCQLNPLLFNGHLQTAWTIVKSYDVPIYYKRIVFDAEDPVYTGTFAVDFVTRPHNEADPALPPRTAFYTKQEINTAGSADSKPMLVVLHGLSGGSYEEYLRVCLAPLTTVERGWEACVVNSRGCANSKITSGVLYNARATWDTRQTVKWLKRVFPNRPLYGIGFSLGANILSNYLGEEGPQCLLKAAVLISCPWNLEVGSLSLQRRKLGRHVYSRAMGTNMKNLFQIHMDQFLKNPGITKERVMNVRYLHEFDRVIHCATWGYPTESAYYRDASCSDSMLAIQVPFFAINATDDPIVVDEAIPYEEFKITNFGVLCTTSLGGHLSWYETGGGRWFAKAATQFLEKMHSDMSSEQPVVEANGEVLFGTNKSMARQVWSPMRRKWHLVPSH